MYMAPLFSSASAQPVPKWPCAQALSRLGHDDIVGGAQLGLDAQAKVMQGQGTGLVCKPSYRSASKVRDRTLDTGKAGVYGMNTTLYTGKAENVWHGGAGAMWTP